MEQNSPLRLQHLLDRLLDSESDSVAYQRKLDEVLAADKEFRLLEDCLGLAKKHYKMLRQYIQEEQQQEMRRSAKQ